MPACPCSTAKVSVRRRTFPTRTTSAGGSTERVPNNRVSKPVLDKNAAIWTGSTCSDLGNDAGNFSAAGGQTIMIVNAEQTQVAAQKNGVAGQGFHR